jgi:hypothetical protein
LTSRDGQRRISNGEAPSPGLSSWRWNLAALLVFFLAAAAVYGEVWREDARSVVPARDFQHRGARLTTRMDVTFQTWLATRNAYTLIHRPHRLFDTEHCAPWEKTMTLGIPMITMGLLAVPISVATSDPILTYNVAVVALTLIAAVAMFLLVTDWTGLPAAGIAAGLLYSFHPIRLASIHHPPQWDTSWTVLALFFAHRLFAHGRWRDALGLALSCALQIGASFYPLLAATFLAPPFVAWLVLRYRFHQVRIAQLACVAGTVLFAAAVVLGPYLEARGSSEILRRSAFWFAVWREYLPGQSLFMGWIIPALALLGLALPRRRAAPALEGDPRWALLAGALIVAVMAAGPLGASLLAPFTDALHTRTPNPYEMLASVLPGLDSIRVVHRLGAGVHLALSVLAGIGVAVLIRLSGRRRRFAAPALILLAAFEVLRAPALGFERSYQWVVESIRPRRETVEFFETLEAKGSRGPLFEVPGFDRRLQTGVDIPRRILLSAYHHRRTSACLASYRPPREAELAAIAQRLPRDEALRELAALGFTTLLVHHRGKAGHVWKRRFAARLERPDAPLRLLHATAGMTAFEIVVSGDDAGGDASPENEAAKHVDDE